MTSSSLLRAAETATEHDYFIDQQSIVGKVPSDLRGTFYRIGPGQYDVHGEDYSGVFDGDGMLHSVTFTQEGVKYINRFVQTPKYKRENAAKKILFKGLAHNAPGGALKNIGRLPQNTANTNIVIIQNRLLALWEGGYPFELNSSTLETLGEYKFDGKLNITTPFSAHPKYDPVTKNIYNFGLGASIKGMGINLYRINPKGILDKKGFILTNATPFCHDFTITEHYAIFTIGSMQCFNPRDVLLGKMSMQDSLEYDENCPAKIYVVSLDTFKTVKVFETDPYFPVHFANCWEEEGTGDVIINMTRFTNPDSFKSTSDSIHQDAVYSIANNNGDSSGLWQFRLNFKNGRATYENLPNHNNTEFMQWDMRLTGRQSNITYSNAVIDHKDSKVFNAIERYDHKKEVSQLHDFGPGALISEAVFVAKENHTDEATGYLITAVYRAKTHMTDIVILDAETLEELALVPLQNHIPAGFHCYYSSRQFR